MTVIVDMVFISAVFLLFTYQVPPPVLPCILYVVAEVVAGESRKFIE
jgi:hypothetical protein